jgi:hypothetical protein
MDARGRCVAYRRVRTLCMTCRQFRNVAQPILFRKVILNKTVPFDRLMNALLESPNFGYHVCTFSLGLYDPYVARNLGLSWPEVFECMEQMLDLPPRLKAEIGLRCHGVRAPNAAAAAVTFMPNL